jgi:hypothetical protein
MFWEAMLCGIGGRVEEELPTMLCTVAPVVGFGLGVPVVLVVVAPVATGVVLRFVSQ